MKKTSSLLSIFKSARAELDVRPPSKIDSEYDDSESGSAQDEENPYTRYAHALDMLDVCLRAFLVSEEFEDCAPLLLAAGFLSLEGLRGHVVDDHTKNEQTTLEAMGLPPARAKALARALQQAPTSVFGYLELLSESSFLVTRGINLVPVEPKRERGHKSASGKKLFLSCDSAAYYNPELIKSPETGGAVGRVNPIKSTEEFSSESLVHGSQANLSVRVELLLTECLALNAWSKTLLTVRNLEEASPQSTEQISVFVGYNKSVFVKDLAPSEFIEIDLERFHPLGIQLAGVVYAFVPTGEAYPRGPFHAADVGDVTVYACESGEDQLFLELHGFINASGRRSRSLPARRPRLSHKSLASSKSYC